MASVKVAVRVRPLNKREHDMGAKTIIEMEGKKTRIYNLKSSSLNVEGERKYTVKDFSFDYSYWSADESMSHFVTQEKVYKDLGTDVVKSSFEGYNSCIFAYGQTGSGKTFTMMGHGGSHGLIPRICEKMFQQMKENSDADDGVSFRTEVSFLEIYQERVRDLLRLPVKGQPVHSLRVREHPKEGPYVQNLTKHLVSDYAAIQHLMDQGNSHRVTASTGMNDVSSRSHAIFTMNFTQAKFDMDMPCETASKINLVDLAGSERADATGLTGERLKEGANINKSLVTLGTVISALADASTGHGGHHKFVPYRDSVLTWLLKDSLGGNSKTVMIATISPADVNYAETMSTLRYANRAKNIINKPTINEDANVKLIRELRSQIDKLKAMISPDLLGEAELAAAKKLSENEARVMQLTDKWKDRWMETQKILEEREMKLQQEGVGIKMDSVLPHLVLVDDDLLSTGIVVYHIKEGKTTVGHAETSPKQDIIITGPETNKKHCVFEYLSKSKVVLDPFNSLCYVNNKQVYKPTRLFQGDVIIMGRTNVFRFNHPREAAELREKRKSSSMSGMAWSTKFRSETDLFRKAEEGALSIELEKAKNELEQQKQLEGQKLEAARAEFEKQIHDEGIQLEEMRAELERQRKLHAMEAQNVEEARKRVSDMERKHEVAETQRAAREKELASEIVQRDQDIKDVRDQLEKMRVKSEKVKQKASDEIAGIKDKIRSQKEEEMERLNENLKKIMDIEAEKNGMKEQIAKERTEMKEKWYTASVSIIEQKEQLLEMKREFENNFSALQEAKRKTNQEKKRFQDEKRVALQRIRENENQLNHLFAEREKSVSVAEDDVSLKREALELQFEEKQVELLVERKNLSAKITEYDSMVDQAAGNLANAHYQLEFKTKEENEKIDKAKKRFTELQRKLADSAKKAEEELELKRQQYDDVSEKRRETISKERDIVNKMRSDLKSMVETLPGMKGNERNDLEKEIKWKQKKLNEQESQLKVLEIEDKNIADDIEEEFEEQRSRIQCKAQEDQTALELERLNLEELQDSKAIKLQKDEQELQDVQKKYNEVKILHSETRKKLADAEKRAQQLSSQKEAELLKISKVLEERLPGTDQHGEAYKLREHRIQLKEIDVEGKMKLADQQENNGNTIEQVNRDIKRLSYELEEKDKAKEKLVIELNEIKEKFNRERIEESATLDAMRESIQDMEEEASLSRSLSENQIVYSAEKDNVSLNKLLEKEKERIQIDMEKKVRELEESQRKEMDEFKLNHSAALETLEEERLALEKQKEELEQEMEKEKVALDKERRMLEREKLEDIDSVIKEKEEEIEDLKEKAQIEIEELRDRLDETEREVCHLQERLTMYASMASVNLPNGNDDEMADGEVMQYMYKDESDLYSSNLSLTGSVTPPNITPPPTPVNQFLRSVSNMRRNQIMVQIPRYILRGLGRDSYHVFEVKVTIGGETWSVYRRYRKFRELHNTMKKMYVEIGELDFPNRRFFGNRAEEFVRARRAQLETYLKSFVTLCASIADCPVSAFIGRPLTKRDLCDFAPFFKQGIFEQTKHYSS